MRPRRTTMHAAELLATHAQLLLHQDLRKSSRDWRASGGGELVFRLCSPFTFDSSRPPEERK